MGKSSVLFRVLYVLVFCLALPGIAHAQGADSEEGEDIVIQATRNGRRVQDEPIRVAVIDREEIEEKLLMSPGNIAMLVSETPGVRVQVTSPALGASNVRMQGLKGRYTQILADGLPLYGGQALAIGLLQIPPTDLAQVEVIKGAASALYGPAALGGVINLVSRRPGDAAEGELLLNATTRNGQDVTGYVAKPLNDSIGASLTGGYGRQTAQDIDGDGWANLPGYERWTARPRLFWSGANGARVYLTAGAMSEDRAGGTLPGRTVANGSAFVQDLHSERFDLGLNADLPLDGMGKLQLRTAGVTQAHRHRFGSTIERDRHQTGFVEASLGGTSGGTTWLAGAAFQADGYRNHDVAGFDYDYTIPALFVQGEQDAARDLTLAASARWDWHSEYGSRISPRLSALYRPGSWTIRTSLGRGFYAPMPLIEEVEANGLSRVLPYAKLRAEVADTGSIDIGYVKGPIETSISLFASNIEHAVQLREVDATRVTLANAAGTTRTRGAELLLRYRWQAVTVTGSYVHIDATEPDPDTPERRRAPLTPRDTAGLVAMLEQHGRGRIGLEAYYTGRQSLDDDPYRSRSRSYVELGLMGELVLGRVSLFVNAENLLDVRQTRWDPLLRQTRAPVGSWTVDAWAPTEGRTINGGIRFRLGAEE
ncbi:TonB-dependent receptor plug domain-containing protein [Sphingomonas mucosissima]|uniref:Colicin I receptor n=1 Tax=Sphingomonas mucosissima TaxID=370959 RepID=A0A245ZDT7_9SPHN|nr:TonB-dependent receptor [Sphingomonas mucosissima]OWK27869.1 colicin I receptor precursor [Sphingomonas mucosissima]